VKSAGNELAPTSTQQPRGKGEVLRGALWSIHNLEITEDDMIPKRFWLTLIALFLLGESIHAQHLSLGADKAATEGALHRVCNELNSLFDYERGKSSHCAVITRGDTVFYRVSDWDEVQYAFVFANEVCTGIQLKWACITCLRLNYRKGLFTGRWRMDENRTLYRYKHPARATIRRVEDCPFLYELNLSSMPQAVSRKDFNKMERVKKRSIGTQHVQPTIK
jgi:hypothetical protein